MRPLGCEENGENEMGFLKVVLVLRDRNNCGVGSMLYFEYNAPSVSKY